MSGVTIHHTINLLERDARKIPAKAAKGFAQATRDTAREGNLIAKGFARESAGAHGKHYHRAFTAEKTGRSPYQWEYGPDAARPQGGMSFETGSRNQPPHLDLARSQDVIAGRVLPAKVRAVLDGLFW